MNRILEQCTRCASAQVDLESIVWLLLRTSTASYCTPEEAKAQGWAGTDDVQGPFPFGKECARIELRERGERWKR